MKTEQSIIWRDITTAVYQNIKTMTSDFVKDNKEDTNFHVIVYRKSLESSTFFSIKINKPDEIEYSRKCWGEETKTAEEFFQELEEFVQRANVVCVERESLRKYDDLKPYELMRAIDPDIASTRWGTEMSVEIFKPQTYTRVQVRKNIDGKFHYYASVHNIVDVEDDDMLDHAMNERPPVMDDEFFTVSVARVKRSVKFIATKFEDYTDIDAYVRGYERTCLMNLKTRDSYGEYKCNKFPMAPGAVEDRDRYDATKPKRFHAELMERAFHPDRMKNVLDENDDLFDRWQK